ncbi:MAG: DEAD/DEAH box helicase [Deltaproteobacteria bacterium]|nr:DEAD/DEAH box helicase [Deltaproteobacteria bacterium]
MEQIEIFNSIKEIELKPLQEFCLNEIRQAFTRSKKIIFQAATGMGKTVIAAKIMESALNLGKKVVFIVDRIVLAHQTSDVLLRYGIKHGVIQAQNERFNIHRNLQICSIQTIKRRGCPKADLIIIDEAHVLFEAHKKIIQENPEAYVLGLTATPYSKGLGKYFDFHIQPVTVKQLIDNKYLVPFEIYGPSIADLTKLKIRVGEFTEESVADVFDKADIVGDVVKTWQSLTPGKKTIVFGANIAHIKHLVKSFQEIGVSAVQINAYQSDEEREAALKSFTEGDTKILCSVEVATKGFDCPAVECCVLAVATRSMIKWTQTTGRALRTCQGKDKATILDFGGNAERLGFPDDYEFLGLDDGNIRQSKKQEAKEKLPKACPSCDFIKPVGVHICPACGFAPERVKNVEVADGELKKLQRKERAEYTIEEKQNFLAQLNQYAEDHRMKRHIKGFYGAAIYAYQDKFGCRPSGKINWNAKAPVSEEVNKYMTYRLIKYSKGKAKQKQQAAA